MSMSAVNSKNNEQNRKIPNSDERGITESLIGILKDENLDRLKAESLEEKYKTK